MLGEYSATTVNGLLKSLPIKEQNLFENNSTIIDFRVGDILSEPSKPLTYIYFPMSGLISIVADVDDQAPYALAMIGCEGMLGATSILGITEAPAKGIVLIGGQAMRMSTATFDLLIKKSPNLQTIVKRYLYLLIMQFNRTAACSRFHDVNCRLARWLLMTHDRSSSDSFSLTQQFLSEILGVQRAAISIAASTLQTASLITYVRGTITILDRKGLEAVACDCYAATAKDQERFSTSIAQ